jgi:hypothetical protein
LDGWFKEGATERRISASYFIAIGDIFRNKLTVFMEFINDYNIKI